MSKDSSKNSPTNKSSNTNANGNSGPCNNLNNDIPGGFQDVPPQVFITLGELIGNITSSNAPFNVQNAIGNWLCLVGQAIVTFNAQQQYFQGGPGQYYNPACRNINNSQQSTVQNNGNSVNDDVSKRIKALEKEIEFLKKEIEELKKNT